MKSIVTASFIAVFVSALAWVMLGTNVVTGSSSTSGAEFTVSFRAMRAYDPATNSFTGTSYFVRTHNGLGCSAVLAASTLPVAQIEALNMEDGLRTWSGSRTEFAATGLPDPCP